MLVKELITDDIPPLKTSDTGDVALTWMGEFQIKHLPIVNNKQFLGLISEDDILNENNLDEPFGNYRLSVFRPFVFESDHVYSILKVMAELKLSIIPVIDDEENYLGVILLEDLLGYFGRVTSITEPGGILVIQLNVNDYLLSEIARIVESNDASILCFFTSVYDNSTKMEITIKVNKTDIRPLITTFERFEYNILGYYHKEGDSDHLKDRFDSLMNYLNI